MSDVCPTLDEMIFAISGVDYNSLYRPTSPPPPATGRLSRELPPMTVDDGGAGASVRRADDGGVGEDGEDGEDGGGAAADAGEGDELGESDDDSEVDDEDDGNNMQRVVSASS